MITEPTPEQIEAAKNIVKTIPWDSIEDFTKSDIYALSKLIAARDAEKDCVIAEPRKERDDNRMEYSAAKGASISFRLRAEQAESRVKELEESLLDKIKIQGDLANCEERVKELEADLRLQKEAGRQQWELTKEAEAALAAKENEVREQIGNWSVINSALADVMSQLAAMTRERDEFESTYKRSRREMSESKEQCCRILQASIVDHCHAWANAENELAALKAQTNGRKL